MAEISNTRANPYSIPPIEDSCQIERIGLLRFMRQVHRDSDLKCGTVVVFVASGCDCLQVESLASRSPLLQKRRFCWRVSRAYTRIERLHCVNCWKKRGMMAFGRKPIYPHASDCFFRVSLSTFSSGPPTCQLYSLSSAKAQLAQQVNPA